MEQSRLYRRTNSGRKALESARSGLPAAYRNLLEMLETERSAAELVVAMRGVFSDTQVLAWLDELDTLCFIEALDPGEAVAWPHHLAGTALQAR